MENPRGVQDFAARVHNLLGHGVTASKWRSLIPYQNPPNYWSLATVCCVSERLLVGIALQHFSDRPTILVGEWWQPVHLLTLGALPLAVSSPSTPLWLCINFLLDTDTERGNRNGRLSLPASAVRLFAASSSSAIIRHMIICSTRIPSSVTRIFRWDVWWVLIFISPLNSLLNEVRRERAAGARHTWAKRAESFGPNSQPRD